MLKEQLNLLEKTIGDSLKEDYESREIEQSGTVISIDSGIAVIKGLYSIKNQELVEFTNGTKGMVFNLDPEYTGIILLGDYDSIEAGDSVSRTYSVADIPVSENFIGRVITPLGDTLDQKGKIIKEETYPIERESPGILSRAAVNVPLQTGIKVIDSVVPIGRGQRELILGDRQTGKTTIAIDTIINQRDQDVICIYCAIGQQNQSVAKIINELEKNNAMEYTVVMVAGAEEPPGISYIAPYAATSLGEYFMEQGKDVLIIYDDLTRHARAYRELSLLLERPPGREAYPGDVFFIHSRLLERATHLSQEKGGGSLTALPIIETQAENLSAYIPTNLISITDGQIYLSPKLYRKGNLPPVNIGKSVSRVGGKTQLPAYRDITSDLKLAYSQFEELESFASFGTRLEENTRRTLERGKRIRAVLNQPQYSPIPVVEQIATLLSVTTGALDVVEINDIGRAEEIIKRIVYEEDEFRKFILDGKKIPEKVKDHILKRIRDGIEEELSS